jgi:hypothetical protein
MEEFVELLAKATRLLTKRQTRRRRREIDRIIGRLHVLKTVNTPYRSGCCRDTE